MNVVGGWIRDYAHMLRRGTVMYFRKRPPAHYLDYVLEDKAPVIMLPGVFSRWGFSKTLTDHLSREGHPVYVVPKLGNNLWDIPTSADIVREIIDENALTGVILVAHSKGGLIGKYLMAHEDPDHRIKGLIAIGTPFHGSRVVRPFPIRALQELRPESEVIDRLAKETDHDRSIISIYPAYDNNVWHEKGSRLDGALENIEIPLVGHHIVLEDPRTWKAVREGIEKLSAA